MFESVHRTEVELIRAMDESTCAMARASSELLRAIAEFDERSLWEIDGTSMTQWLSARYSVTYATAVEWVRVARALRSLPAIAVAYWAGQLSWDQVRPLTKFATPETDAQWAQDAPSWSCTGLWLESRRREEIRREETDERSTEGATSRSNGTRRRRKFASRAGSGPSREARSSAR